MKKIEIQMLLYTLIKNFMKVQENILNTFDIILFYKMERWFDDQNIGVKLRKPRFNPHYQHILCGICIYLYIYHVRVCNLSEL
jgi:hypothetical protein